MKKHTLILITCLSWMSLNQAAEFCVTSSAELQSALTSAANNAQHDVIKIAEGSYLTPGSEFSYFGTNSWDLEISGGWSEFFGNPCGQQLTDNAFATALDGNQMNRVLRVRAFGTSDITISNLMLINGKVGDPERGGGLHLYGAQNEHLGDTLIERVAFVNNEAKFGGAISISGGNKMSLRNNLFVVNHSLVSNNVSIVQNDTTGVFFTNNTVYANTTDTASSGGLRVYTSGTSGALVANNVLWDNDNSDLDMGGGGDKYLHNNDIGIRIGSTPISDEGNFSLPPRFEGGLFNFTPSAISPLVNAGRIPCFICPIPVPFDDRWGVGDTDVLGNERVQDNAVDIGAYESDHSRDLIFMHVFD